MADETFDPRRLYETKRAPETPLKLYRGFTVNPENLSLDLFKQPLVPGSHAQDDPTRIGDGNERGVYMSTNSLVAEKVYSSGGRSEGSFVETLPYNDRGGQTRGIKLPVCGILVEISTEHLPIREPKMLLALQGHYNNGFEGYEWIADLVPPDKYKVIKLILSTHPNDRDRLVVDVRDLDDEKLQDVIEGLKIRYRKAKEKADSFSKYLRTLTLSQRMNDYVVQKKWIEYQSENGLKED